ncbi:hypothetical protein SAMN05216588_1349 [Pseudomonas flavescens]|uniref:MazG C-terminal domain-containing protein n=1 Tax=Phytopseudomonas flavescens TaxID=29435 RepID=A0A1G8QAU8_9GAMM|nr:hypothetical protein [Pseudomonas flavescens]SDJ01683.1 hypothetical protein SAMN05216588_1349 [Pseudomonas flavescens]
MSGFQFITVYEGKISDTDRLSDKPWHLLSFGLYGEVGSILSVSKKAYRENAAFDQDKSLVEELGDALWYFSRLCNRRDTSVAKVLEVIYKDSSRYAISTSIKNHPIGFVPVQTKLDLIESSRVLGYKASAFLVSDVNQISSDLLEDFLKAYIDVVSSSGVSFKDVIDNNLEKSLGRFLPPALGELPDFDKGEDQDEQLPREFIIEVSQRSNGKTYMKKGDVFIGDPLTDNIEVEDGYRFHDVFHMAYAVILHWSPVFRALLKNKRKSNPEKDESQDGGRAIVIEEGLSAWIFSIAKEKDYFETQSELSFDILKNVKQFVQGYEVDVCPYALFEKAILDGYKVFRELKINGRGYIIGSREKRSLEYSLENPRDAT